MLSPFFYRYICPILLIISFIPYASGAASPLKISATPIPFNESLSFFDILNRKKQYIGDITRMAGIADAVHALSNNPSHEVNLFGKEEINTVLYYLSTHGSSQLGYYCEAYFKETFNLMPHEKKSLIELILKSKIAFASLSKEDRHAVCLGECQYYRCAASRYRFPEVRTFATERIADGCKDQTLTSKTCCFFISGDLAHEYKILKRITHLNLKKIILIDKKYETLMRALRGAAEHQLSITDTCSLEPNDETCNDIFTENSPRAIEIALDNIFTLTATARIINEFNTRAKKLFPNLAKLLVYATATEYIAKCKSNPNHKSDILIACDFKSPACQEFKLGPWRKIHDDFNLLQTFCVKEAGLTWSLTTSSDETAHLNMTSATKKREWLFQGCSSGLLEGLGNWSEVTGPRLSSHNLLGESLPDLS